MANSLKKAYLKQDITEADFNRFKSALNIFFNNHNQNESEEHQKNDIAEFLKSAFYKDSNLINTKNRIDLAIYNGTNINDTVGVLIEVKSTKNKSEMISFEKPNAKALQEAISYYLEESITHRNKDIKHIIVCTPEDWYIFDGAEFERAFYKNSTLIQNFANHRQELFGANTTGWFYSYLQDDIIPKIEEFSCTYINFRDYKHKINSPEYVDDLILLFKILSPEHLLKKPFANDSNTLDTQFYDELLHLLGLEEVKDSGKKVLLRLPESKRIDGSLLENTIRILDINNSLDRVANLNEFGANKDEQLFSIGLELCITWLNRILFLKLLESQLIKYNNNDYSYKFLSNEKISDFDELNELFFEVLAIKTKNRANQDKQRFAKIPYLNSSLFEQTKLEKDTIAISALKDRYTLPIYQKSVLKTLSGDKRTGELKFQEYLFEFLDAYNFASVSKASIQQTNKTIINSSVLGLIFEKLNGYKDGSYFTPGYITMYMCREAISLAVVNKFNQHYNWSCKTLTDIYNKLESNSEKYFEYNSLINSIRLVDPAVGSGHFLVSALNEFINIKAELGVLIDKNGKRLKDYKFYIENDELIIVDNDDNIFSYLSPEKVSGAKRDEMQRIQETIFHEKQTIIENCLFGVDINPKSVSISRLRLWIELLKFMYYKFDSDGLFELETLPNIDINIKSGNSLVSRFPIDDNAAISIADSKVIPLYKNAVNKYKNVKNGEEKRSILKEIENYKLQLKGVMTDKSNKLVKLNEKKGELQNLISQTDLFNEFKNKKEEKEFSAKVNKLTEEIQKLEKEVDELSNNPVYHNAFEWRFEFPEVLDDIGNFIGFDVVIGNPPYISSKEIQNKFLYKDYCSAVDQFDLYSLFIELSSYLLRNNGFNTLIVPDSFLARSSFMAIRKFLYENTYLYKIVHLDNVFSEANVSSCIYFTIKKNEIQKQSNKIEYIKSANVLEWQNGIINKKYIEFLTDEYINSYRLLFINEIEFELMKKIFKHKTIDEICKLWRGEELGKDSNLINNLKNDLSIRIIQGNNVSRYELKGGEFYINKDNVKKDISKYSHKKIVVRQLGDSINATISKNGEVTLQSVYCLFSTNKSFSNEYILAVLNSKLINFLYKNLFSEKQTFPRILLENLKKINIPEIDNKSLRKINQLVDIILKKKEQGEDTTAEERTIDMMVYKLYELTEEEIRIVEGEG